MSSKWVPLEASPEVFNALSYAPAAVHYQRFARCADGQWARRTGLPDAPLSFQDLFSLDPEFLSFVGQPVKAVLLLFPARGKLQAARVSEDADDKNRFTGKDVWFINQTIPNACGSIGLLHALLNLPEGSLDAGSPLVKFKDASLPLDAEKRAALLNETDFFSSAHTAAAQEGQSAVPTGSGLDVDTHFIAFVEGTNAQGEKRVVELDGNRAGPFDCGPCTDLLRDTAKVVQERYFDRAEGDVNFNMIVLAGEPA